MGIFKKRITIENLASKSFEIVLIEHERYFRSFSLFKWIDLKDLNPVYMKIIMFYIAICIKSFSREYMELSKKSNDLFYANMVRFGATHCIKNCSIKKEFEKDLIAIFHRDLAAYDFIFDNKSNAEISQYGGFNSVIFQLITAKESSENTEFIDWEKEYKDFYIKITNLFEEYKVLAI